MDDTQAKHDEIGGYLKAIKERDALIVELQLQSNERLEKLIAATNVLNQLKSVVNSQADDCYLWGVPLEGQQSIAEAHLQLELRKLHALIEFFSGAIK